MIAFASSLDTAGLMTQSAEDAALVFNHMLGFDPKDSTSIDRPGEDYARHLGMSVKGLKIGVPKEFFGAGLQPDVEAAVRTALDEYRRLGAELVEVSLPNAELGIPVYYVVAPAECSSNLSRFDGVRYGHRAKSFGDLTDMIKKSRAEGFGPEPKRRILIGTYVLSHGYYDAYYIKAQQVRRLIADEFQRAFQECDIIAGPVTTSVAFGFGEKAADPVSMYMADLYTVPGSLAGVPSMSIPCGFGSGPVNGGRPVGLQLIANYFDEARMLAAINLYQFDDAVTAPVHGFAGADDYWQRASAKPWLKSIAVPALAVNPKNDPFLPAANLPTAADASPLVRLEQPASGGHVGFVSGTFPGNLDWLPHRLLHFFLYETS
jgi:aspartyl-tRNA(Asn)/glutamyl-tRNA(Gln) amidotransferase subunit A